MGCRGPDVSCFTSQVVKACNEGVRKMSRTEQMISIQKKMEFKIKVSPHPPACPHPAQLVWSLVSGQDPQWATAGLRAVSPPRSRP